MTLTLLFLFICATLLQVIKAEGRFKHISCKRKSSLTTAAAAYFAPAAGAAFPLEHIFGKVAVIGKALGVLPHINKTSPAHIFLNKGIGQDEATGNIAVTSQAQSPYPCLTT